MKKLHLASDLSLPADEFIETATGIIGKRGRGKTGLIKVIMEECCKASLPFIAFDPIGVLWGIRSSADGKHKGYEVLIVGGPHGDIRLDRRAGAEVAKAVVQANCSCILDFSEEPRAAYREFVRDFAHTIHAINDSPRLLILEEAPELVPQRLRPDMTECFEAVERLVSRGRNKGLGVVFISQRAATLNKDVLTQADTIIVFGLTSPQDRKALQEWVEAKADAAHLRTFEAGLAALERQHAWLWSPEAFQMFRAFKVRPMETFHPDKTHLRRQGLLTTKPVQTDVSGIITKLGATMDRLASQKTEQVTVGALQRRIKQLEAQRPTTAVSTATLDRAREQGRQEASKTLMRQQRAMVDGLGRLEATIAAMRAALNGTAHPVVPAPPAPIRRTSTSRLSLDDAVTIGKAHRRILQALVMLGQLGIAQPSKVQTALWAAYSPNSGGFNNAMGSLRTSGLVGYPSPGTVAITPAGVAAAGPVDAVLDEDDLHAQISQLVGPSRWRIVEAAMRTYPEALSKQDVADAAGFTINSGGFNNYLGSLRSLGVISYPAPGMVKAESILFIS